MKSPKFWKDSGNSNDTVVSTCIGVCMLAAAIAGWKLHSMFWLLAAIPLGILTGLATGLGIVFVLCTFFNFRDRGKS